MLAALSRSGRNARARMLAGPGTRNLVVMSPPLFKDKPSGATKGLPRKSKFQVSGAGGARDGANNKPEKKEKTAEDQAKLEAERKEREQKKKETRAKQLEIQKKRDEAGAAKKAAKKA
jgi:hypothetical protein